jgi:hypothetical protein
MMHHLRTRRISWAVFSLIAISSALHPPGGQHPLLLPTVQTLDRNFSVGFSIESDYGAVAIILQETDGNLETHTRVCNGSKEYSQVLTRLSLEFSRHLAYVLSPIRMKLSNLSLLVPLTKTMGSTGLTSLDEEGERRLNWQVSQRLMMFGLLQK